VNRQVQAYLFSGCETLSSTDRVAAPRIARMKIDRSRLVGYPEQLAIYSGDIVGLQGLLVNDDGAANRPHHDWLSPLVVAIALNRPDMVELLIEAGADTDCIVPLSLIDNLDIALPNFALVSQTRTLPVPSANLRVVLLLFWAKKAKKKWKMEK
jgi:hypothetical protein